MTRSVLLTGNRGYIGTVMTAVLKEASYRVVGLDTGYFEDNLLYAESVKPDAQIAKDIRKIDKADLDGMDAVIHLAGLSNDPLGDLDPVLTDEINHRATINLAKCAKAKGVARFIFASSCSIYGISSADAPVNEEGKISPLTAYARAKVDAERGLSELAGRDFHPVYMRNATVYGLSPRLRLDLVVNNLLAWAYLTGEVSIMSDGTPWRPIIHVRDFCNAFLAALEAPAEKIHDQALNVGLDNGNYQIREIADVVQKAVPESRIKILNKTGGDDRSYRVDFSKIRKSLPSFRPAWNLRKGVDELLSGYRKHELTPEDFKSDRFFRIRTIKSLREKRRIRDDLSWEVAR